MHIKCQAQCLTREKMVVLYPFWWNWILKICFISFNIKHCSQALNSVNSYLPSCTVFSNKVKLISSYFLPHLVNISLIITIWLYCTYVSSLFHVSSLRTVILVYLCIPNTYLTVGAQWRFAEGGSGTVLPLWILVSPSGEGPLKDSPFHLVNCKILCALRSDHLEEQSDIEWMM